MYLNANCMMRGSPELVICPKLANEFVLAAGLPGKAGQGPIVAIVSGGNIDLSTFCELINSNTG